MNQLTITAISALTILTATALSLSIKSLIKNTIKSAIQHGFDQKLEIEKRLTQVELEKIKFENQKNIEELKAFLTSDQTKRMEILKREIQIRDRSAKIAELIAEWLSYPEEQKTLNTLTLEAFLWLPDDILKLLSQVLAHDPNAPDVREVLAKVRKHLRLDSNLDAKDIIIFKQETAKKWANEIINKLAPSQRNKSGHP
jgi:hypothetical protein